MKKKIRRPSAILAVILSVLMLLSVFPVASFARYDNEYYYADGTDFVSEIAFTRSGYWDSTYMNALKNRLSDAGYNPWDKDFNDGCGTNSDYIAGGWKYSKDISKALRDVKFWVSDSGSVPQYYDLSVNGKTVRYYLVGGTYEPNSSSFSGGGVVDLNGGAGGKYIYAFVTRDPNAGPPITYIKVNTNGADSGYNSCTSLQAPSSRTDLNSGAGGDDIFMHLTSATTAVSTANLQNVYNLAVNMIPNRANYTSDTYRPLETAYNNAKPIVEAYNNYGAGIFDQAAINTAYNDLYSAVYNAETNVYFNASNNGGTTTARATTVKIGPNSTYAMDVSSFTATKGNWNFLGWSTNKDAKNASTDKVTVGFNNTLYAIFGKDVTTTFKYLASDGTVITETGYGTIYNTAIQADVTAPAANNVSFNNDALAFVGWRDDATAGAAEYTGTVPVKDGITYVFRAVYSTPLTVSFDNNGGETAAPAAMTGTKYYNANDTVVEGSADFTLPSEKLSKTGYAFLGWSEDKDASSADYAPGEKLSGVKEDITLYAVWSQNSYPVVFKNFDGEILQETDVLYGEMPEYTGEVPFKAGTIDIKWVFDGWTPAFSEVTGAQEYTATFYSDIADYLVQFVNADGTVLQESMVDYLGMPEYLGEIPEKAADAQYTYTFEGWDKEFAVVEGAQVYTATYSSELNSYSVKFVNEDGTVLQEDVLLYGETPVYEGKTPEKEADAQYSYKFDKWDNEIKAVEGDQVYTATYQSTVRSYVISFVNYDGTVLYEETLAYGKLPAFKGDTPKRPEDRMYEYSFSGWTPEIVNVTGEATYEAQYAAKAKQVIVTFFNFDGNVLESKFVDFDSVPVYTGKEPAKKATAKFTYVFTGWDKELEAVTERTDYIAQFDAIVNEYTVVFENYDGTVLQSEVLPYGSEVSYKGETPERATDNYVYQFIGWNKTVSKVTGDVTYTAVFDRMSAAYTVKFLNEDGSLLYSAIYAYGDTPVYEGPELVKAYDNGYHYEFSGWNKEIAAVTENTVYVAVYTASAHSYDNGVVVAPSCTENGSVTYTCECGYSYVSELISLGHSYEYTIDGETAYKTCTKCGDTVEVSMEEAKEALGITEESAKNCKYCGKYHYKYIHPDLGFISCLISRIFTFFAELFVK